MKKKQKKKHIFNSFVPIVCGVPGCDKDTGKFAKSLAVKHNFRVNKHGG